MIEIAEPSRRQAVWAVAGLLLLGAALRLGGVGLHGLWLDEATSLQFARQDLRACLWAEVNNPPLHRLLLHLWIRLAGTGSDAALRVPAAVFGALAALVLWPLARRVLSRGAALLALALFVLDPYHLLLSQELRAYSLLVLLVLLSWWLHLQEREASRQDRSQGVRVGRPLAIAAALAATLTAGLYTHYQFAWVALGIGAHRLWWWTRGTGRQQGTRGARLAEGVATLWPLVLALSAFAPWLWEFVQQVGPQHRGYTTNPAGRLLSLPFMLLMGESAVVRRYPETYTRATLRHLWLVIPFALAFAPLAVGGVRALWRQGPGSAGRFLLWAGALPVAGLALLFPWLPLFTARYLSFLIPVLCVICAAGAVELPGRRVGLAAAGLLMALQIVSLGRYHLDPRFGREDWRGAAAWVMARQRPGDMILFDHAYVQIPFDRYHRREGGSRSVHGETGEAGEAGEGSAGSIRKVGVPAPGAGRQALLQRLGAQPPERLFLVLSHCWDTGRQSLHVLQRSLCLRQSRIFRTSYGIEVHLLKRCEKVPPAR